MRIKTHLRILAIVLLLAIPFSNTYAIGGVCVRTGVWVLRHVGHIAIKVFTHVITDSVTGAVLEQVYNGSNIPLEPVAANINADDVNTSLSSQEISMLKDECDRLGGTFPSGWSHIADQNSYQEERIIFIHNYSSGSVFNGGAICLTT